MEIYNEVFERLNRIGISQPNDALNIKNDGKLCDKASEIVVEFYLRNARKLISYLNDSDGNKFVFYDTDGLVADAAKKALLYSQVSGFVSSQSVKNTVTFDVADSDGYCFPDDSYDRIDAQFLKDLLCAKPVLLNGAGILLPNQVLQNAIEPDGSYNMWVRNKTYSIDSSKESISVSPRTNIKIPEDGLSGVRMELLKENALRLLATNREVHRQLAQKPSEFRGVSVRLLLPNLQNIPIEKLIKLREDEGDAFIRFQHRLRKYFCDDSARGNVQQFLDMLKEVDYEIRILNKRVERFRKKAKVEISYFLMSFMGLLSLYIMPSETAKLISQVIGVTTVPKILKYIVGGEWSTKQLDDSDFYYAWKISTLKI